MDSECVLVVGLLKTESSYKDEIERPTEGVPDTVQFWFTPTSDWRIRTYSIDHDIHIHHIGPGGDGRRLDHGYAIQHIQRNYGDIVSFIKTLIFEFPLNVEDIKRVLKTAALDGELEYGKGEIGFYKPDRARYRSQSTPK